MLCSLATERRSRPEKPDDGDYRADNGARLEQQRPVEAGFQLIESGRELIVHQRLGTGAPGSNIRRFTRRPDRRGAFDRLRRYVVLVAAVPGLIASFAAGIEAQRAQAVAGDLFLAVDQASTAAASLRQPGPGSARERFVRVDLDHLEIARMGSAGGAELPVLRLNLFEDVRFAVVVERATPTSGGYSLSGRLDGDEGTMSLVVHDGVVAGSVFAPGGTYEIRPVGDEVHVIRQVDPAVRSRLRSDWLRPRPHRDRDRPARRRLAPRIRPCSALPVPDPQRTAHASTSWSSTRGRRRPPMAALVASPR